MPQGFGERKHYPPEEDLMPEGYAEDPVRVFNRRRAYSQFFYTTQKEKGEYRCPEDIKDVFHNTEVL